MANRQYRTATHSNHLDYKGRIRWQVVSLSARTYDNVHLRHIVTVNQRQCMLTGWQSVLMWLLVGIATAQTSS